MDLAFDVSVVYNEIIAGYMAAAIQELLIPHFEWMWSSYWWALFYIQPAELGGTATRDYFIDWIIWGFGSYAGFLEVSALYTEVEWPEYMVWFFNNTNNLDVAAVIDLLWFDPSGEWYGILMQMAAVIANFRRFALKQWGVSDEAKWVTFNLYLMGLYPLIEAFLTSPSKTTLLALVNPITYILWDYFPETAATAPYSFIDSAWYGFTETWWNVFVLQIFESESDLLPDWAVFAEVVGIFTTAYLAIELADSYNTTDWMFTTVVLVFYFMELFERNGQDDAFLVSPFYRVATVAAPFLGEFAACPHIIWAINWLYRYTFDYYNLVYLDKFDLAVVTAPAAFLFDAWAGKYWGTTELDYAAFVLGTFAYSSYYVDDPYTQELMAAMVTFTTVLATLLFYPESPMYRD